MSPAIMIVRSGETESTSATRSVISPRDQVIVQHVAAMPRAEDDNRGRVIKDGSVLWVAVVRNAVKDFPAAKSVPPAKNGWLVVERQRAPSGARKAGGSLRLDLQPPYALLQNP